LHERLPFEVPWGDAHFQLSRYWIIAQCFQANAAKDALDDAQNPTLEIDPNLRFFTSRRVIIVASKGRKSL
jgi:hypothetical protein